MTDAPADLLNLHGVDAAIISHHSKVRRLCGFTGSRALLLIQPRTRYLVTDPRYSEQAKLEVHGATVVIGDGEFQAVMVKEQLLDGANQVLFESDHWTIAELAAWKQAFPATSWVAGMCLLQRFVACKSSAELGLMRKAQKVTEAAFEHILRIIRPGMTEQEVAAELVYAHLRGGADRMSFDPIVASGPHSALPHARPTDRRIRQGEVVLLDIGCIYQGYASDMTRLVVLGEPDEDVRRVYDAVLRAQSRAIAAAKAGIQASALDAVARSVVEESGYGPNFIHGLGHGIGLDVHEWPRVSRRSQDTMPAGVTITIEPGVYLPGKFGIRIEDTVVLREGGCERLGSLGRELFVV